MITATAKEQTKAKHSQVGQSLLAQIRGNFTDTGLTVEDAEALCAKLHGCALDEITNDQAYQVLRAHAEANPVEVQPHDGYCISCNRASSLRQCMNCREGHSNGYRPRFHSVV